ncbi:hypothetical protein BaRGS_00005146 [Batillaria attramentaria]|uniref:Ankyrin n=1 Tax=Batillaria attramentaria TaxID=370345 RepID=A0ABD0LXB6_9CAEN
MKKFFKNIRKKSPARSGPPPGGSPVLGASRGSTASLVIGYDVREKELGKLHKAAWIGDLAKVQQLAKKDPSPLDKENRTPLHLACAQGHERIVQELLEWKAKTNIGDADSRTPLMKAVECRHENCVELLLRDRVELNSVDSAGNTSLHIAANDGSTKIVKMLCAAGANMTIKNKEGLTPLHVAVKEKHEDVCRVILSNRGQVDIEDNNLRTPLMYACQDGSITLVKLLLDSGASTEHRDAKGWSADDCAVIQGHHTCSQLISDHNHRQQRGSTASTPRSTAGSRSATPRGPSPFAMPPTPRGGDKDSASFGLPVADAGGDESGDETLSKASAKGAGSDSWGDDTDVSLAEDRKGKGDGAKINLAKLVGHLPSESDDGGGGWNKGQAPLKQIPAIGDFCRGKLVGCSRFSSDPRRSAVRVSFKGDKELSEVHDITATESEAESDHYYSTIPTEPAKSPAAGSGYIPSAAGSGTTSLQLSPEKQREFMEDLGLGDVDDISEVSEASDAKPARPTEAPPPPPPHSDSEWDSTVKSDLQTTPRPGILKKWNKGEDASDWDSTVAEETPAPPLPSSPQPKLAKVSEWEDDVERIVVPTPAGQIPKEVEVMMRRQQAEAQDTDEDDSSSQHNDVKAVGASDLLSVTIEQSAKEYLGNDSLDTTPQGDALDKPSQDSEWDSTVEAVTPRAAEPVTREQVAKQESDWDSTAEAVTPRAGAGGSQSGPQKPSDDIILSDEDDLEAAVAPSAFAPPIRTGPPPVSAKPTVASSPKVTLAPAKPMAGGMAPDDEDEDEESGWDSDGDMLPSDAAPPLPVDAKQQQKQQQEGLSDTDDEMEKTETISEWEVERKQAKEYRGHVQDEGDDDITDLTEAGRIQPFIPQLQQQMEQEAMGDDDKASSEDDSLAHEEYGKPVPSPTHQMTRPSEEVDSCQHNSSNMASTTVSPAQDIQVSQPG